MSSLALTVAGYLTLFSIGLGLLVLAIAAGLTGTICRPTPLSIAIAALVGMVAAFPLAFVTIASLKSWSAGPPNPPVLVGQLGKELTGPPSQA